MRILVTADLHYDIPRSREPARRLARRVCAAGGDALVLVGDTAGADLEPFRQCLGLFEGFRGRRLLVPGNHCLWARPGESSLERYDRTIPSLAAEAGFAVLDHGPVAVGEVGLVGSIGWYDYSFREEALGIPVPFYRAKVAPGAAAHFAEHRGLLEAHEGQVTERHLAVGSRWMDGVYVDLPVDDEAFLETVAEKLRRQLADLAGRVERIAAFLHHVPFAELIPRGRPDRFAFAAAYMGSGRLGEVLRACPCLTHVYCGHTHWPGRLRIGRLTVVNVGSTYRQKRLEILEL